MKNSSHKILIAGFALFVAVIAHGAPTTFTVKVSGHGEPMILIPGLACPGDVWDTAVVAFSSDYECHVLSLAGFGGTPAQAGEGPLLTLVRDELTRYIEEHHLAHPIIVGHSLGGFVALQFAVQNPTTPKALVIVDSLPFLFGVMQPNATLQDAERASSALLANMKGLTTESYSKMIRSGPNGSTMAKTDTDLDRIVTWGVASDPSTVAKAMREMYTTDLRESVVAIKAPTLVLGAWIGYAPYSSHEIATRLYSAQYEKLPNATIQISDTARHFIMFDDPEWLWQNMRTFLESSTPKT